MADRGRKAFPVSSHLCDERWQRHCMDLHKQRLADMRHRIDNTKPETFDLVLSKGKRHMLDKERQTEVDRENAILLQKMVRIKETDTRAVFRPWTARSTFQWKVGHYCDPATNTKTLDHINLTSSVSPRSIHYFALTRPGTAPPDVTARLRDMEIQVDNTKLLRAITTMKSHYDVDAMERRHMEESILVSRISNFRGPDHARYLPPNRSISATRGSPYLAPLSHRSTSPTRQAPRGAPRTVWSSGPVSQPMSQQQYYEEAQNRDIPPPTSRSNSRPGTAIGGTLEGLGETTPRHGGSHSSRPSISSASSHSRQNGYQEDAPVATGSGAGSRAGSAKAGTSFSFGAQEEQRQAAAANSSGQGRASSSHSQRSSGSTAAAKTRTADPGTSAEDYGEDDYEQDGDQYEDVADQEHMDSGQRGRDAEEDRARGSGGDEYEEADAGDGMEEEGYGAEHFDADDETAAAQALRTSSQMEEEQGDAPGRSASRSNSKATSSAGGSRVASAKASGSSYDEEAPYGEDYVAAGEDEDPSGGVGGAQVDGTGAAGSYAEDAAAGGDGQQASAEASYDAASGGAALPEEDPEEALRAELRAAEETEMQQQFAVEMAADVGDEHGGMGDEAALGGESLSHGSRATTASLPKPGGFAADWD